MIETVAVDEMLTLDDYQAHIHLSEAVRSLRTEARALVPHLEGRTVWMVNSTARGGGVAEMMPRMITIFRELGVDVKWVVIGSDKPDFFTLTKRLHNLIHGSGDPGLGAAEREVY
ncbi:MAG: glycosyl transferase family 1, partial [Acidobacteria bacterium]|nr:glycosyl transferase family 1 [Acidobacteriota bacterium]